MFHFGANATAMLSTLTIKKITRSSSSSLHSLRSMQLIVISVLLYCSALGSLTQAQELQSQNKMSSSDNSYQVVQLPGPRTKLGEGPVWDIETQSLYYVDIDTPAVLRYDYADNRTYSAKLEGANSISFIVLVAGQPEHFVVGENNRVTLIRWDGRSEEAQHVRVLADLGNSQSHVRFNDGKVDPSGRLYAGTMQLESLGDLLAQKEGQFFRYTNETMVLQKKNISVSNGLTWDEPVNPLRMYYIDSAALDVKSFDVDENGDLKNETVFFDLRVNGTNPGYVADGMTSDADGNLYIATWGGSKVMKVDKRSQQLVQEIKIPAEQVTSVAFGGPQLDELFVTTSSKGDKPAPAGELFKVTGLGVKGKPMHKMIL
ncbi:regucalcin-like isoform X1 [Anopheles funestus]|uniref:regucalcin-like isoform X1 n=2 Tax=Anopheles funestus TaxID=62324 RepID=UPI0020C70696|nr:regucalcin-like isoform X1 [Anopheles funestus]